MVGPNGPAKCWRIRAGGLLERRDVLGQKGALPARKWLEWSCGREAEGGGLLNRYRVVKPYRGFESLRLRHPLSSEGLSGSLQSPSMAKQRSNAKRPVDQRSPQTERTCSLRANSLSSW